MDHAGDGIPRLDARLRLFDSIVTVLSQVAADGGLVVALDDLHAADEASLRLQHVATALPGTSLLVIGTYRDAEIRSSPHLHRLSGPSPARDGAEGDDEHPPRAPRMPSGL